MTDSSTGEGRRPEGSAQQCSDRDTCEARSGSAVPRPYRDSSFKLSDGRRLAYAEFGDPNGDTVLWFHGTPGARWQIPPDGPRAAIERGFRVVGVDRPGIGGSSHHNKRTLLSWTGDVAQLLDHLGAEKFAAIGLSGGGPYVLACAHELPERMVAGVSLGGVGPLDGRDGAPGFPWPHTLAARAFWPLRGPFGVLLSLAVQPLRPFVSPVFDLYARFGPATDREVLGRPDMKAMFSADIIMATRLGLRGPVFDLALFGQPWGFSPRDIRIPIRIWHGSADLIVPTSHSEHLADVIPDCELQIVPDLGHFAGFVNVAEVLDAIAACWDVAPRASRSA